MTIKKWPEDYPPDLNIPPDNAVEINANLYRFVQNSVPNSSDFLASYKDPSQANLAKNPRNLRKPGKA